MSVTAWQITELVASIILLQKQISAFSDYTSKLKSFAGQIGTWADEDKGHYQALRANDIDFYNYYRNLPDYTVCDSAIDRSKGAAFYRYGSQLRRGMRTNRGYTPMTNVHLNNMLSPQAVAEVAVNRSVRTIKEKNIMDDHVLERWSAITGAPVGVERYHAGATSAIISESFRNIKSLGQGINSAGATLGSQIYEILN